MMGSLANGHDGVFMQVNSLAVQKSDSHKQRDLYFDLKCAEDPDFGFIPLPALRSAVNTSKMTAGNPKMKQYECDTQRRDSLDELFIGIARGVVHI